MAFIEAGRSLGAKAKAWLSARPYVLFEYEANRALSQCNVLLV